MNELNLNTTRPAAPAAVAKKPFVAGYVVYYALLLSAITAYALMTVFHGSQALVHADRVAQAEKDKRVMVRKNLELKEDLAQQQSLNKVALHENVAGFESVSKPLVVDTHAAVALR